MLLIVSNINAQIESDITFNYRNIKTDTIIKYNMLSNQQWALSLNWDTISTAPDSLYTEQSRLQDSINLYASDTLLYYNLASTNCGDTVALDSIVDTLNTLVVYRYELDTSLNALKDSATLALTAYLELDTTYQNKLDSVPIVIAGYEALELVYTALRDTAYLTDSAAAILYNDTVQFYDSLSKTGAILTTYYKNLKSANRVKIFSTQTYITTTTKQITSNLANLTALLTTYSTNVALLNIKDSLCTLYNSLYAEADSIVSAYVLLQDSIDSLITLSDSLIGVSLQYTIYMSNDAENWSLYDTNYDVTSTDSKGNIMFTDNQFTGKYFGLRIRSTSVTRGYIRGIMLTKYNFR